MFSDFGYAEEGRLGKPYDMALMGRLMPFARPYAASLVIAVGISILITLLELSLPYLTKIAVDLYIVPPLSESGRTDGDVRRQLTPDRSVAEIDDIVRRHPELFIDEGGVARIPMENLGKLSEAEILAIRRPDMEGVGRLTLWFILIIALDFLLNFFQAMIMESAGQNMMHDLRLALFTHIQSLHLSYFNRTPTARLVTRATNDIQNMYELFTAMIGVVFRNLFLLVGITVLMTIIQWKLALICFSVLPLTVWASYFFSQKARDVFRDIRVKTAEINSRFSETIGGIPVLQIFGKEAQNSKNFQKLNHEFYVSGMRQIHIYALFMPIVDLLTSASLALVIFFGGAGVLKDSLSLGVLIAFISYMRMFFRPIRDLAEKYNILQNAMSSAERLFQILDTREHLPMLPGISDIPDPEPFQSLAFDDVSFSYSRGEPVLKHLSFSIEKGQTLAIVGPTGSGKSSIINLMVRFYDPDSGAIRINGRDLRHLDIAGVRSRMALVTQDPFLFSDTIRANIFLAPPGVASPAVDQVLEASNCHDIIRRLPDGLDTRLSERGASLSSGERQLISIARAFARDPDLILLDEATSYIDSETEVKIHEALDNLMKHRTAVIVAHRLATARNANRILVLKNGRIIESGTHQELLDEKGFYYQLYQLQNHDNLLID